MYKAALLSVALLFAGGTLYAKPPHAQSKGKQEQQFKKHKHQNQERFGKRGQGKFSHAEQRTFREYYGNLPPGLAKKYRRTGTLPPGCQHKVEPGMILAPDLRRLANPGQLRMACAYHALEIALGRSHQRGAESMYSSLRDYFQRQYDRVLDSVSLAFKTGDGADAQSADSTDVVRMDRA